MDPHIRDNFNAIFPIMRLRKTADESVTSSAVLQDDDHLTFSIAANEVWIFQLSLWVNTGAGGIQTQITGPAGSSGVTMGYISSAGTTTGKTAALNAVFNSNAATFTDQPWRIEGTIVNGATPGTCRLQWAQSASNGTASTIKANSFLLAHRIA